MAQILYDTNVVDDDRCVRDNIRRIGGMEFRGDTRVPRISNDDLSFRSTVYGSVETSSRSTAKTSFQLGTLVRWKCSADLRQ